MKRSIPFLLALGLILGMGASQSLANTTYLDNTLVQASASQSGYIQGHWYDIVGGNDYNLYKMDVTWRGTDVIIDIYTNTDGSRMGEDYVADLALDLDQNGVWETGIVLKNNGRSNTYRNSTMYTFSNKDNEQWQVADNFQGGVWGTNYDRSNNPDPKGKHESVDPPVRLKTGAEHSVGQPISVSWLEAPSGSPSDYLLELTLKGVNANGNWNNFDLLWGTQTCANDTMYAQVHAPIPASIFLLGSGLLGLSLVGWRRKDRLKGLPVKTAYL